MADCMCSPRTAFPSTDVMISPATTPAREAAPSSMTATTLIRLSWIETSIPMPLYRPRESLSSCRNASASIYEECGSSSDSMPRMAAFIRVWSSTSSMKLVRTWLKISVKVRRSARDNCGRADSCSEGAPSSLLASSVAMAMLDSNSSREIKNWQFCFINTTLLDH